MYPEILAYLCCPSCKATLVPRVTRLDRLGAIDQAELTCTGCSKVFLVHDGIADFLGPSQPATLAQQTNNWPLTAWAYERWWRPFALTLLAQRPFPYRRELPFVINLAQPVSGLALDIACSNGLYARALARTSTNAVVAGIDHSWAMLCDAQQRARKAQLRISYIRAEAQHLPFSDQTVACTLIGGSLNEIGNLRAALAEVHRTLDHDGRFVAMSLVRARTAPARFLQRLASITGIAFWTPKRLVSLMSNEKLIVSEQHQYSIVLFTRSHISSDK